MSTDIGKEDRVFPNHMDTLHVVIVATPGFEGSSGGIVNQWVTWVAKALEYDFVCQAQSLTEVIARLKKLVGETLALDLHDGVQPFHCNRREPEEQTVEEWEGGLDLKVPLSLEPIPEEFRGHDDVPMRAIFRVC